MTSYIMLHIRMQKMCVFFKKSWFVFLFIHVKVLPLLFFKKKNMNLTCSLLHQGGIQKMEQVT
jgi:hypothetical protein